MKKFLVILLAGLSSGCADGVMGLLYTKAKVTKIEPVVKSENAEVIHKFRISGNQTLIFLISPKSNWVQSGPGCRPSFSQNELKSFEITVSALSRPHEVSGFLIKTGQSKIIPLNQYIAGSTGKFTTRERYTEQLIVASLPFATEDANPKCDFLLTINDTSGITRSKGINISGGFQDGF
jgi:hypothetical protein